MCHCVKHLPYILGYKSKNFGQYLDKIIEIWLIRGSNNSLYKRGHVCSKTHPTFWRKVTYFIFFTILKTFFIRFILEYVQCKNTYFSAVNVEEKNKIKLCHVQDLPHTVNMVQRGIRVRTIDELISMRLDSIGGTGEGSFSNDVTSMVMCLTSCPMIFLSSFKE